jgi:hypothetical protein
MSSASGIVAYIPRLRGLYTGCLYGYRDTGVSAIMATDHGIGVVIRLWPLHR